MGKGNKDALSLPLSLSLSLSPLYGEGAQESFRSHLSCRISAWCEGCKHGAYVQSYLCHGLLTELLIRCKVVLGMGCCEMTRCICSLLLHLPEVCVCHNPIKRLWFCMEAELTTKRLLFHWSFLTTVVIFRCFLHCVKPSSAQRFATSRINLGTQVWTGEWQTVWNGLIWSRQTDLVKTQCGFRRHW